jgi:soluble P-type ATPase
MIELSIPGFNDSLQLHHLLLDFNGTLAIDGKLIKGVKKKLVTLSQKLQIHILTGDTYGTAMLQLKNTPFKIALLPAVNQRVAKEKYISNLSSQSVISIGNGRNDKLMLKHSAISIIVIEGECASVETMLEADIMCTNIHAALDMIINPLRLKSTLRS